jgi:ABC-2 type transport system ATP-binding protein
MTDIVLGAVTQQYRAFHLGPLSLSFGTGMTAVLGPNGSGKSTLLRTLATVVPPASGVLMVAGERADEPGRRATIRRGLGYLAQHDGLPSRMTVYDYVDYVAILKELGGRRERHRHVYRALSRTGLLDDTGRRLGALSGGVRRRAGLAQALLGEPGVVVLDEPDAHLDPRQRKDIAALLAGIGFAATVITASHHPGDTAVHAHRVIVLNFGRLAFDGTPTGLAAQANGHVWTGSSPPPPGATAAQWATQDGLYRWIGPPAPHASAATPTIEDGYLVAVAASAGMPPL